MRDLTPFFIPFFIPGRKRHILVDTLGLLLNVVVRSADVQDRDGARFVLDQPTRRLFPFIERIFADAGYQGAKAAASPATSSATREPPPPLSASP